MVNKILGWFPNESLKFKKTNFNNFVIDLYPITALTIIARISGVLFYKG